MVDTSKNCHNFSTHLKSCDLADCNIAKVLLNLNQFYSVMTAIQYFRLWKSDIMDQFMTFRNMVYRKPLMMGQ